MPGKVKGLYMWCLKVTSGYEGLEVRNLTTCWKNGLAFCAIISRFRPELIDYYSLNPDDVYKNNDLAFTIAEREFGIIKMLDPEDMVNMEAPDRLSMATYLAQYYDYFRDKSMFDPPEAPEGYLERILNRQKHGKCEMAKVNEKDRDNAHVEMVAGNANEGTERPELSHEHVQEVGKDDASKTDDEFEALLNDNIKVLQQADRKKFKDLFQEEIEDIKASKKGAVMQALVSAGIAAVAATAVGDADDSKDQEASIPEHLSVTKETNYGDINANLAKENDIKDGTVSSSEHGDEGEEVVYSKADNGFGTFCGQSAADESKSVEEEKQNEVLNHLETEETVKVLNAELIKGNIEIVNISVVNEENINKPSVKEVTDRKDKLSSGSCSSESSSSESSDSKSDSRQVDFERMADEIVKSVIKDVQSNPELLAELQNDIPSLVKEVESSIEAEQNETRSTLPDNQYQIELGTAEHHKFSCPDFINPEDDIEQTHLTDSAGLIEKYRIAIEEKEKAESDNESESSKSSTSSEESREKSVDASPRLDIVGQKQDVADVIPKFDDNAQNPEFVQSRSSSNHSLSDEDHGHAVHEDSPDGNIADMQKMDDENNTKDNPSEHGPEVGEQSVPVKVECHETSVDIGFENEDIEKDSSTSSSSEDDEEQVTTDVDINIDRKPEHVEHSGEKEDSSQDRISSSDSSSSESENESEEQNDSQEKPKTDQAPVNYEVKDKIKQTVGSYAPKDVDYTIVSRKEVSSSSSESESEEKPNADKGPETSDFEDKIKNTVGPTENAPEDIDSRMGARREISSSKSESEEKPNDDEGPEASDVEDMVKDTDGSNANALEVVDSRNVARRELSSSSAESESEEKPNADEGSETSNVEDKIEGTVGSFENAPEGVNTVIIASRKVSSSSSSDRESENKVTMNFEKTPAFETFPDKILPSNSSNSESEKYILIQGDVDKLETSINPKIISEDKNETSIKDVEPLKESEVSATNSSSDSESDKELKTKLHVNRPTSDRKKSLSSDSSVDEEENEHTREMHLKDNPDIKYKNDNDDNLDIPPSKLESNSSSSEDEEAPALPSVGPPELSKVKIISSDSDSDASDSSDKPTEDTGREVVCFMPSFDNESNEQTEETFVTVSLVDEKNAEAQKEDTIRNKLLQASGVSPLSSSAFSDDQVTVETSGNQANESAPTTSVNDKNLNSVEDNTSNTTESSSTLMCHIPSEINNDQETFSSSSSDSEYEKDTYLKTSTTEETTTSLSNIEGTAITVDPCSEVIESQRAYLKPESEIVDDQNITQANVEIEKKMEENKDLQSHTPNDEKGGKLKSESSSSSETSESESSESDSESKSSLDKDYQLLLNQAADKNVFEEKTPEYLEIEHKSLSGDLAQLEGEIYSQCSGKDTLLDEITVPLQSAELESKAHIDSDVDTEKTYVSEFSLPSLEAQILPKEKHDDDQIVAKIAVAADIRLEWSNKAREKLLEEPPKQLGPFASVDKDLMKKAAIMSRKMAKSLTAKLEDQNREAEIEKSKDDDQTTVTPPPTPSAETDTEIAKAKRMAIFKQLQYSTRPTKKKIEDIDDPSESSSCCESPTDFKKKMFLWNRKSSTYVEPDHRSIDTKPKKISSPFLSGKPLSPSGEHMKKLHSSLPKDSAPGSVADYIRRLSQSSSADENSRQSPDEEVKPVRSSYHVSTEPIRLTVETKIYPHNQQRLNKNPVTGHILESDSVITKKNEADVKASSIFAGQPILRRHSQNQRPLLEKIGVRPRSIDLKNITNRTNNDGLKPTDISVKRFPRSVVKYGKLNVEVKPLDRKPVLETGRSNDDENSQAEINRSDSFQDKVMVEIKALDKRLSQSDEERQDEEKKTELKRKESLKKREDSPRRTIVLSSPTTPEATIKDGERVRNIWQSTAAKPPSPKIRRKDSFEVKVRPASLQKSREEKEMEKEQRNSTRSASPASRPPTPTKDLPKVNITVKPFLSQSSQDENTLESPREPKETVVVVERKPPLPKDDKRGVERKPSKRRSILSVVNQRAGSKPKDKDDIEPPVTPEKVSNVHSTPTSQSERIRNASTSSESSHVSDRSSDTTDKKQTSLDNDVKPATQSDSDSPEKPVKSSYKQEQDREIKKCNSIFGLVRSRIKPPAESKKDVSEKGLESVPSSDTVDGKERMEQETDENKTSSPERDRSSSDSSSSSSRKAKKTGMKRGSPGTINADVGSGRVSDKDTTKENENGRDKANQSGSSSPSLHSSVDIDKTDLKEDLKDIIKDFEQDMKSDSENFHQEANAKLLNNNNADLSVTTDTDGNKNQLSEKQKLSTKRKKRKKKRKKTKESSSSSSSSESSTHSDTDNGDDGNTKSQSSQISSNLAAPDVSRDGSNNKQDVPERNISDSSDRSSKSCGTDAVESAESTSIVQDDITVNIVPETAATQSVSECSQDIKTSDPNEIQQTELMLPLDAVIPQATDKEIAYLADQESDSSEDDLVDGENNEDIMFKPKGKDEVSDSSSSESSLSDSDEHTYANEQQLKNEATKDSPVDQQGFEDEVPVKFKPEDEDFEAYREPEEIVVCVPFPVIHPEPASYRSRTSSNSSDHSDEAKMGDIEISTAGNILATDNTLFDTSNDKQDSPEDIQLSAEYIDDKRSSSSSSDEDVTGHCYPSDQVSSSDSETESEKDMAMNKMKTDKNEQKEQSDYERKSSSGNVSENDAFCVKSHPSEASENGLNSLPSNILESVCDSVPELQPLEIEVVVDMPVNIYSQDSEDDELLRSVIEDSLPFKAPLLETVIKTSFEEDMDSNKTDTDGTLEDGTNTEAVVIRELESAIHHGKPRKSSASSSSSSSSDSSKEDEKEKSDMTDSEDDLYSDSKKDVSSDSTIQYILPECTMITCDNVSEKDMDIMFKDLAYAEQLQSRMHPASVEMFVQPDTPEVPVYHNVVPDHNKGQIDDFNDIYETIDPRLVDTDYNEGGIFLEGIELELAVVQEFEQPCVPEIPIESDDELLKHIIQENEMNLKNIVRRKSSTSSSNSENTVDSTGTKNENDTPGYKRPVNIRKGGEKVEKPVKQLQRSRNISESSSSSSSESDRDFKDTQEIKEDGNQDNVYDDISLVTDNHIRQPLHSYENVVLIDKDDLRIPSLQQEEEIQGPVEEQVELSGKLDDVSKTRKLSVSSLSSDSDSDLKSSDTVIEPLKASKASKKYRKASGAKSRDSQSSNFSSSDDAVSPTGNKQKHKKKKKEKKHKSSYSDDYSVHKEGDVKIKPSNSSVTGEQDRQSFITVEDIGSSTKEEDHRSRSDSFSSSSATDSESDDVKDKPEDGNSDERFLIGREKDPSKSEVARLIQQSLELDRRREEQKRQEHERLQALHDSFLPRDEVMEHEHMQRLHSGSVSSKEDDHVDLDASSQEEAEVEEAEEEEEKQEEEMEETEEISEELQAGEATPLSMPSGVDSEPSPDSSPDEDTSKAVVDVFDLQDSSPDVSPEMEPQALFVKLKEAQCRNSVLEAELSKLKGRLLMLENAESQRRQEERRSDDMAARLREVEKALNSARKEINHYQDLMEGSQGQYIALEKKMQGDLTALEKKYHKAKKLIKEYQQREKDFLAERESLLQQQNEKNQQYDALVKSLKDRIFQLERELREAQQAAGLPVLIPASNQARHEVVVATETSPLVKSVPPPVRDSGIRPVQDKDSISSESEVSSASEPPTPAVEETIMVDGATMFESVPPTKLLDTSASKAKAQLAANSPRRPPTKQRSKSQDSEELIEAAIQSKTESGLETWIKHDRTAEYILNLNFDNTVKKSDVKKRKAAQQDTQAPPTNAQAPPQNYQAPPLDNSNPPSFDPVHTAVSLEQGALHAKYENVQAPPTSNTVPAPPPPPVELTDPIGPSDDWDTPRDRLNSGSESSSTISQTSYDPSQPNFRNKNSEIPGLDSVSTDTSGTVETTGSESSSTAKKSKGLLPKLPFKFGSSDRDKGGGITLISARGINSEDVPSSEGGITLISKRKLDTGLDFDGASINSDTSSGYMVGETESARSYQFSGTPASEDTTSQSGGLNQFGAGQINDWTVENVKHWLIGIEMERYTELFTEKGINGAQLATMDANKMKAMGITNTKDKDYLKKRLKELRTVLEKERKQQEKERKQMEKEAKAREKEQKKQSKKK